jgi:hypothetical protein
MIFSVSRLHYGTGKYAQGDGTGANCMCCYLGIIINIIITKKIIIINIVLNRFCVQRGVYVCELFLIKKLAGSYCYTK